MKDELTEEERQAAVALARRAIANAERVRNMNLVAEVYVGDEKIGTMNRDEITLFNAGYRAGSGQDFDTTPFEPWPRERVTFAVREPVAYRT